MHLVIAQACRSGSAVSVFRRTARVRFVGAGEFMSLLFVEFGKVIPHDRLSHLPHQPMVERQIVGGQELPAQNLFGFDEMVKIRARVVAASLARTVRVNRRFGELMHRSAQLYAGYQTDSGWRFDLTGNVFYEDRDNGTPASINSTASRHGAAAATEGRGEGQGARRIKSHGRVHEMQRPRQKGERR